MSELRKCLNALEALGKQTVTKSLNGKHVSPAEARGIAIAKASETPAGSMLVRKILNLQSQKAMRMQYAPFLKNMPEVAGDLTDDDTFNRYQEAARRRAQGEDDEDDWSSKFSEVSEDDLLQELKETREREAEIIQLIREIREA